MQAIIHRFYRRCIWKYLKTQMAQQRFKLLAWDMWGYFRIFLMPQLSLAKKIRFIRQFLRIDWSIPSAHKPAEFVPLMEFLVKNSGDRNQAIIEAGCWKGALTCKLSLLAREFHYWLLAYDSFEGVEELTNIDGQFGGMDYSGQYVGSLKEVRAHVEKYGSLAPVTFIKGWFVDTLAAKPPSQPVALAYIDCDLRKRAYEVLQGVLPSLTAHGAIYNQDYHIPVVRDLLNDPQTWRELGVAGVSVQDIVRNLARIEIDQL